MFHKQKTYTLKKYILLKNADKEHLNIHDTCFDKTCFSNISFVSQLVEQLLIMDNGRF